MTKNTWRPGIWGVAPVLLAALAACVVGPQPASAAISGDTFTITARHQGTDPFVTDITVGPGAELADGSGTLGGYPRAGESVDCDNSKCVFTFGPLGLQGSFELSGLDSLIERDLLEITITGNLVASSDSHLTVANPGGGSFARFTVDCNPFLAVNPCLGGTVEVNFVFAPVSGGDPLQAVNDLIDAVVAQNFESCRAQMLRKLKAARRKIEQNKIAQAIDELNLFINVTSGCTELGFIGPIGDAMAAVAEEIIGLLQAA